MVMIDYEDTGRDAPKSDKRLKLMDAVLFFDADGFMYDVGVVLMFMVGEGGEWIAVMATKAFPDKPIYAELDQILNHNNQWHVHNDEIHLSDYGFGPSPYGDLPPN